MKQRDKEFEAWADRWQLDEEERKELASSEAGEWKSLPPKEFEELKKSLQESVRHTLAKSESISIRLTRSDLYGIKAKATQEGIPYQTLISSLIHKYVTGKLS